MNVFWRTKSNAVLYLAVKPLDGELPFSGMPGRVFQTLTETCKVSLELHDCNYRHPEDLQPCRLLRKHGTATSIFPGCIADIMRMKKMRVLITGRPGGTEVSALAAEALWTQVEREMDTFMVRGTFPRTTRALKNLKKLMSGGYQNLVLFMTLVTLLDGDLSLFYAINDINVDYGMLVLGQLMYLENNALERYSEGTAQRRLQFGTETLFRSQIDAIFRDDERTLLKDFYERSQELVDFFDSVTVCIVRNIFLSSDERTMFRLLS